MWRINFSNIIYRYADKYHVSAQLSSRNITIPDYNYESIPPTYTPLSAPLASPFTMMSPKSPKLSLNFGSKFHQPQLKPIYIPKLRGLEVCLHRRGTRWYLVFGRAYGMANGWKLAAQLNNPGPNNTASEPPSSHSHLNRRFWLRDGGSWETGLAGLNCEDLLGTDVEPGFLKDTGIRRVVAVEDKGVEGGMKLKGEEKRLVDAVGGQVSEERLVEVLLKDEELSQRCAYCGGWEYTYDGDKRHKKIELGNNGKEYHWCGVSNPGVARVVYLFS
jgi:hypothetical protein